MRIKGKISEFAIRIEDKRSLFNLPELDEREFEFMLAKAKQEAMVKPKPFLLSNFKFNMHGIQSFFEQVIISPRVAAVLVFTILAVGVVFYNNASPLFKNKPATAKSSTGVEFIDKNTRIPIENDNVVIISTYTEKYF